MAGGFLRLEHLQFLCSLSWESFMSAGDLFTYSCNSPWIFDLLMKDTLKKYFWFRYVLHASMLGKVLSIVFQALFLSLHLCMGMHFIFFFSLSWPRDRLILHASPQWVSLKLWNFLDLFKVSENPGEEEKGIWKGIGNELSQMPAYSLVVIRLLAV